METSNKVRKTGVTLDELFRTQMDMNDKEELLELPVNEESEKDLDQKVLIVKPHGFKPPPIKIVAANLHSAWQRVKGV